jgi:mechanosensitive ion channel-like protein
MRDDFVLILTSLRDTWYQIAAFLPRVLVALVLLIVGWLLARGLRWLGERLLRLLRVDLAAERTGVDDFLLRGGVRFTVVTLTGQFIYWVVLLIFVIAMFSVLGLSIGPDLVARLTGYVPSVVAALAILVFGSLIARFIRGLVEAYLNNFGVKASARIAMLVHGTLLAFVAILALEQVGIAVDLLTSAFKLAFGGLCLGLALAFGLGGRSWAESILERTRSKR